jgi:hypothetical protein
LAAAAGAALAGGFSSHTTAFFSSLRGDSSKSPESFSVPHTYWSIVTSSFFGAGTGPLRITEPLIEPAALMPVAPRPTSSSVAATVNCIPLIAYSSGAGADAAGGAIERFDGTGSVASSVARAAAPGQDGRHRSVTGGAAGSSRRARRGINR